VSAVAVEIKGVAELQKKLEKINLETRTGFQAGLEACGDFLLEKSSEAVPVKTGALKGSGGTESEGSGYGTVVKVRYGGESAPYAPFVHEFSKKGRKFLEGPARKNRSTMRKILAESVRPGSTAKRAPRLTLKKVLRSGKKSLKKALRSAKKAARRAVKAARRAARKATR